MSSGVMIYGLKNCDTCRKARKWLEARADVSDAALHDLRADGLNAALLARWCEAFGWEALLNRRGTTWRGLSDAEKEGVDEASAAVLMLKHPALIKRPVFEVGEEGADGLVLGFDQAAQAALEGLLKES